MAIHRPGRARGDRADHRILQLQQPATAALISCCRTWSDLLAELRGWHRHSEWSSDSVAHQLALARAHNPGPLSPPPLAFCKGADVCGLPRRASCRRTRMGRAAPGENPYAIAAPSGSRILLP